MPNLNLAITRLTAFTHNEVATVHPGAAKILCVEHNVPVRDGQCSVLKTSGYDAVSASPQLAEIVLRCHKFDLLVVSWSKDRELQRVINLSDGAEVLVLDEGVTTPSELLALVAQRLNRQQRSA